jgi:hypothetical protein
MLAPLSLSLLFWPAPTFYLSCSHLGQWIESCCPILLQRYMFSYMHLAEGIFLCPSQDAQILLGTFLRPRRNIATLWRCLGTVESA